MPKVAIIADDLTGAADCGAVFAERGFASTVLLGGRRESGLRPDEWHGADVLAIDADTRSMGREDAAGTVSRLVHMCGEMGAGSDPPLIFKKVDSTLRGNVAGEIAAALAAMRAQRADSAHGGVLLAPAFPARGRTTVNGCQLVYREPLEWSDAWRRERTRPHASIAAMLAEAGLSSRLIELACVRAAGCAIESATMEAAADADVVICDAETDADLEAVARAGLALDRSIVWAGSAGLARQLARWTAPARRTRSQPKPSVRGSSLFVAGSPAGASREQARELAKADISVFLFTPSDILGNTAVEEASIAEHLQGGHDVLVQLDPGYGCAAEPGPELARRLAGMIAPAAKYAGALFATGGETARAILDAWGIRCLQLIGEVEPGLPYSAARCAGRELLILTKAGGFGTCETLLHCREFLKSRAEEMKD